MKLPRLKETDNQSKRYVVSFDGINYGRDYEDGQFSFSENLSTREHPCLSQREGRERIAEYTAPTALFVKGELCVVDGTDFIYGGEVKGQVTAGEKLMASVGYTIVIFPDKVYYNTQSGEFGSMENERTTEENTVTFTASELKVDGVDFGYSVGDAIEISGCEALPENNKTVIIREVKTGVLTFYDNTFTEGAETAAITLKRPVPDFDAICESNNRLWGGAGNTIHGSALGSPFNFSVFDGLSTDSFAVDVGTDGEFTGCISYSSHIAFFKEGFVHKLYGNRPANFQMMASTIQGVKAGCAASMQVINETLYYLGRDGVYAYTGGVPELVSEQFGLRRFADGVGGTDGSKYYISMRSVDGWGLYVYDILKDIWVREDGTRAVAMVLHDGLLHFLSEGAVWAVNGADEVISWSAVFCPFHEVMNDRKAFSSLSFRLSLEAGAWLEIEVNPDGEGWRKMYTTHDTRARTLTVPIVPNNCDSFEVRLKGRGRCTVWNMARTMSIGGER